MPTEVLSRTALHTVEYLVTFSLLTVGCPHLRHYHHESYIAKLEPLGGYISVADSMSLASASIMVSSEKLPLSVQNSTKWT